MVTVVLSQPLEKKRRRVWTSIGLDARKVPAAVQRHLGLWFAALRGGHAEPGCGQHRGGQVFQPLAIVFGGVTTVNDDAKSGNSFFVDPGFGWGQVPNWVFEHPKVHTLWIIWPYGVV